MEADATEMMVILRVESVVHSGDDVGRKSDREIMGKGNASRVSVT